MSIQHHMRAAEIQEESKKLHKTLKDEQKPCAVLKGMENYEKSA